MNVAQIDCNRGSLTPAPPPRLSPFDGPSCSLATLVLVAGIGGAMGAVVVSRWLFGLAEGIEDALCIGVVGLCGGATVGMYGGVVSGQIARVIFQRKERRYYQLAGALVTGALSGVVLVNGFLWAALSAMAD